MSDVVYLIVGTLSVPSGGSDFGESATLQRVVFNLNITTYLPPLLLLFSDAGVHRHRQRTLTSDLDFRPNMIKVGPKSTMRSRVSGKGVHHQVFRLNCDGRARGFCVFVCGGRCVFLKIPQSGGYQPIQVFRTMYQVYLSVKSVYTKPYEKV